MRTKRCLVLNCSRYKVDSSAELAAIDRYNGPKFQLLRGYLAETKGSEGELTILILSAKYGLIASTEIIPNYDMRMTEARAWQLRPQVMKALQANLVGGDYSQLFVLLSRDYYIALNGFEKYLPREIRLIHSRGSDRMKSEQLKRWLFSIPNTINET